MRSPLALSLVAVVGMAALATLLAVALDIPAWIVVVVFVVGVLGGLFAARYAR
jgi:hypothetical protein